MADYDYRGREPEAEARKANPWIYVQDAVSNLSYPDPVNAIDNMTSLIDAAKAAIDIMQTAPAKDQPIFDCLPAFMRQQGLVWSQKLVAALAEQNAGIEIVVAGLNDKDYRAAAELITSQPWTNFMRRVLHDPRIKIVSERDPEILRESINQIVTRKHSETLTLHALRKINELLNYVGTDDDGVPKNDPSYINLLQRIAGMMNDPQYPLSEQNINSLANNKITPRDIDACHQMLKQFNPPLPVLSIRERIQKLWAEESLAYRLKKHAVLHKVKTAIQNGVEKIGQASDAAVEAIDSGFNRLGNGLDGLKNIVGRGAKALGSFVDHHRWVVQPVAIALLAGSGMAGLLSLSTAPTARPVSVATAKTPAAAQATVKETVKPIVVATPAIKAVPAKTVAAEKPAVRVAFAEPKATAPKPTPVAIETVAPDGPVTSPDITSGEFGTLVAIGPDIVATFNACGRDYECQNQVMIDSGVKNYGLTATTLKLR